jgi:hypothetical protein
MVFPIPKEAEDSAEIPLSPRATMLMNSIRASLITAVFLLFAREEGLAQTALASTALTYQGALTQSGVAAAGAFDFTFQLFTDPLAGTNVTGAITNYGIAVSNGLFTTTLDFGGAVFNGSALWLELGVETNGGSNSFAILAPRQPVTATPYAIMAAAAGTLTGSLPDTTFAGTFDQTVSLVNPSNTFFGAYIGNGGSLSNLNAAALTGFLPSAVLSGRYSQPLVLNGAGNQFYGRFIGNGSSVTNVNASLLGGLDSSGYWQTGGNAGTVAGNYLGTSDDRPLELHVYGARALRLEPNVTSPNFIAGVASNMVGNNIFGATIAGGGVSNSINAVMENFGTVGGGQGNTAASVGGTVSGGYQGLVKGFNATVGGGLLNSATDDYATVAGGTHGSATAANSTVGGGLHNTAGATSSTVAGGIGNTAAGPGGTVGGGTSNTAIGTNSVASGGTGNTASGVNSTVAGGSSNLAAGDNSAIIGGLNNNASGVSSLAAGAWASAAHDHSFVWSDGADGAAPVSTTGTNQFIAQASGGFWLYSSPNAAAGVTLPAGGGSWSSLSDRNTKTNFAAVDERELLDRLDGVPISFWSYKSQDPSVRHMGPMAQDLYAAFGLGEDNRRITAVDSEGLALAAAQGLHRLAREQELSIEKLRATAREQEAELAARARQIEALEKRLADLESAVRSARPSPGEKSN